MQDTLVWVAEKGNVTKEDFAKFVNDFVVTEKEVVLDDSDSARKYIKSQKQFKAMFDTEDEMNEALDLLEDRGKLLSKARELHEKTLENKKSEAAKQVELAKQEKADKIAREKEFAQNIQKELESFQWTEAKKQEVLPYLNANKITETWQQIVQSPKAFAQFGDILSHFKDGSFDKLYNILEGKKGSKEAKSKLSSIEKDSLSKLLKGGQEKTEKVKHDDSWWQ